MSDTFNPTLYNRGKQAYELQVAGYTNDEIMQILSLKHERRVREAASYYAKMVNLPYPVNVNQHRREVTTLVTPEPATRKDLFYQKIDHMLATKQEIRLITRKDLHIPDHNPLAWSLYTQVLRDFQPDIIVDGSDAFDFETISRWPTTLRKQSVDIWDATIPVYQALRAQETKIVPQAISFFEMGNHDIRFLNWIREQAPQLQDKLERDFINAIEDTGTYWLGEDATYLSVGPFLSLHGYHGGPNPAAKIYAEFCPNYMGVVAGHCHRSTKHEVSGFYETPKRVRVQRTRGAYTTGCMCNLVPSYSTNKLASKWNLGFAVVIIKPQENAVHVDNLFIDSEHGSLIWGGKVYYA